MICKSQKTIFYSQQNIENMSNVPTNSFKKKKKKLAQFVFDDSNTS